MLVVDRDLHVVARDGLAALAQEPGIGIRSRHLCLSARLQSIKINLRPRALGHERRNLLPDIRAIPAAIGAARRRRLRRIVAIKRGSIGLNVALQRRYLLPQLLAGRNARLAGVTVEERPVDRHKRSTHQIKRARQQHEIAVGLNGFAVGGGWSR